jgi:RHS repeat-associated protein
VRINGSPKPGFGIQWLLTDQLGTPRMVFDESGGLNNVKRHDYLPFGEEVSALGLRTSSLGYSASDGVRQQFTQKERDVETGLDYSINRYYSPSQGRFTSPDPMNSSAIPMLPQTWNRYSYTINNPLLYTDPKGLIWGYHDHDGIRTFTWYDTFDESVVTAAGDTPYTQSQYFSNQAGTDAVYLGSNGNARHISQDEYAAGVVDEYLRGPESPLNDKEKGDLQRKFALRLKAEHPEWNFWAALFGGLAGGLAEGGAKGAEGAAAGGIDAEALTLSKTVEGHLDDITKFGTRVRPYGDSRLVMKEIMEAGKAVPDPGGVPGGLRWDVPGTVNGSKGTWELVIDTKSSTVLHFVFKSASKQ